MDPIFVAVIVIGITALLTAILSAIAGLGGGTVLLGVIAQFFPPIVAIPIQGAIQFVANAWRATILREQVSWPVMWRASILILPASFLGVAVAASLPENGTRVVLGCFILVTAWRKDLLQWRGAAETTDTMMKRGLFIVGGISGFLNTTVGASGPFTSPFLKAVTASHTAFVATAAATQVPGHAFKIISFGTVGGVDLTEHLGVIAAGIMGVGIGTLIGTRLLGRIREVSIDRLFKLVLTLLAMRLILRGFGVLG